MTVGRFLGRDIIHRPTCPFCGLKVEQPKELETRMPQEMPVGKCSCGAVYAFDVTGHNLGTAMIEALVFGCDGDWDLAWGLLPEDDYIEGQVENYDIETHCVIPGGAYEGRRISGTLYFIRLHEDIREVTDEGTNRRLEKATPISEASSSPKGKMAFSKKEVETLVKDYKIKPLLMMAKQDKRIIRHVKRLLYTPDDLGRLRAADALGQVSAVIAQNDPGTISRLLQGLFTALSDTAASSWGYMDAIGEIISDRPELFAGYVPQLNPFLRDRALLPDALRALGRIGESSPDIIRNKAFHFIPLLQDPESKIRGYTAVLLGNLVAHEAKDDLEKLRGDAAEMDIYRNGRLEKKTIDQLAKEALSKLDSHSD